MAHIVILRKSQFLPCRVSTLQKQMLILVNQKILIENDVQKSQKRKNNEFTFWVL
jgi:hypothetical protein